MSPTLDLKRRINNRARLGSALAEFAPALMILILVIVIPLLDLVAIPVRWMLAQEIVNDYSRRLALCETFSNSYNTMNADPSLRTRLKLLGGVDVKSINLTIRISRVFKTPHAEEKFEVSMPGRIPPQWLPDGKNAPCCYAINLQVDSLIAPAVLIPSKAIKVPGLTAPVPVVISASHEWENFGRDPANGKYFLNE